MFVLLWTVRYIACAHLCYSGNVAGGVGEFGEGTVLSEPKSRNVFQGVAEYISHARPLGGNSHTVNARKRLDSPPARISS